MSDKPYLFPHPEQKRAYRRFCDSLPSTPTERLIKMVFKLDQKPDDAMYLEAVQAELNSRAKEKITEVEDGR